MCLALMFLGDMLYDPLMIMDLAIIWTCVLLIHRCRYLCLQFLYLIHIHIVLLCHLLG